MSEKNYEIHIVGYTGTDLNEVPSPFFLNRVDQSTQGFAVIATAEVDDVNEAYAAFDMGRKWSEEQVTKQNNFAVHVKLEALKGFVHIDNNNFDLDVYNKNYGSTQFGYINDCFISAWDVHVDGIFHPELKEFMYQRGYIILDYKASNGELMSTLTIHFLQPETCIAEYHKIKKCIADGGGFSGGIYYEDPLGFVVFGETIPRPIVVKASS